MKILMFVQSTWLRRGNHLIPGRKRKMHFSRERPLVLPPIPVKRHARNVASPNTKRKIALFSKTSNRRQRVVKVLQARTLLLKVIMQFWLNFSSMNINFDEMPYFFRKYYVFNWFTNTSHSLCLPMKVTMYLMLSVIWED